MNNSTGPDRFLTGDRAQVVLPAEVVAKLLERTSLDVLRVSARGDDSDVYDALMALRMAALAHPSSESGTFIAEPAELGPYSQLTVKAAAIQLGIGDRAVRKAIQEGRLHATLSESTWLITLDDVRAFRATRRK